MSSRSMNPRLTRSRSATPSRRGGPNVQATSLPPRRSRSLPPIPEQPSAARRKPRLPPAPKAAPGKGARGRARTRQQPASSLAPMQRFAHEPTAPPSLRSFASGQGVAGNQKELVMKFTVYRDYAGSEDLPVFSFTADMLYKLSLASAETGNDTIMRPEKIEVFALPRAANAQVATTSYLACFCVPTAVTESASGNPSPRELVAVRSTLINPTFNVKWHLIGICDYTQTFKSAVIQPDYIRDANIAQMVLFRLGIYNSDDASVITDPVQLMIRITASVQLPMLTTYPSKIEYLDDFVSQDSATSTINGFAQAVMMRLRNVM